jgi:hypothetical protein
MCTKVWLGNLRGERDHLRPGQRQQDIKIDLKEIICYEDVNWINLALVWASDSLW